MMGSVDDGMDADEIRWLLVTHPPRGVNHEPKKILRFSSNKCMVELCEKHTGGFMLWPLKDHQITETSRLAQGASMPSGLFCMVIRIQMALGADACMPVEFGCGG
jgi:hypothetical protein